MKEKPKYMMIYGCKECGLESGFTELDFPFCRYCDSNTELTLISKDLITPELMSNRLKQLTDNMMKNLESAFQTFSPDKPENSHSGEIDPKEELLDLMEHAEKLKKLVGELELKDPNKIQ